MDEKELNKFMYEKAIEERKHLLSNYNWWTNMFAIINGALFIALYSLKDESFLALLVPVIGFFAAMAWNLFIKSYYSWIVSWIKVVSFYEKEFSKSVNETEGKYMYRLFAGANYPFSTQKITKVFSGILIVGWSFVLFWKLIGFKPIQKFLVERSIPNFVFFLLILILVIVFLVLISKKIILKKTLCDDLSDSHKKLNLEKEKFSIDSFEKDGKKS